MNFYELMQRMSELDQPVTEEPNEGNEFSGKLKAAKLSGEKEFEVDGKTYPVKEDDDVEEGCGMPGMAGMPGGMMGNRQPDNVSMNISMNAQGAGGLRDLMNVLKDIQDGPDSGPMDSPGPGMDDANMMIKQLSGPGNAIDDDFANEPDETYHDIDAVTGTGDDLHSKGTEAPPVNGGGNPMKVRTGETFKLPSGDLKIKLESLYQEIKTR